MLIRIVLLAIIPMPAPIVQQDIWEQLVLVVFLRILAMVVQHAHLALQTVYHAQISIPAILVMLAQLELIVQLA